MNLIFHLSYSQQSVQKVHQNQVIMRFPFLSSNAHIRLIIINVNKCKHC